MLHPERPSLASLGPEFSPETYTAIIGRAREASLLSLQRIANPDNPLAASPKALTEAKKSVSFIRRDINEKFGRGALSITNQRQDVQQFLQGFHPRVADAVVLTHHADSETTSARRRYREVLLFRTYIDEKPERDKRISARAVEVSTSLGEIQQNTNLTPSERRIQKTRVINNALKEMKNLAPEAILKSMIKGEKYHPKSTFNSRMIEFCENRTQQPAKNQTTEDTTQELARLKGQLEVAKGTNWALQSRIIHWQQECIRLQGELGTTKNQLFLKEHTQGTQSTSEIPDLRTYILRKIDRFGQWLAKFVRPFWKGFQWQQPKHSQPDYIDGIAIPVT